MTEHLCVSGTRCLDKVDDHARETEHAGVFCDRCLKRASNRVAQLPEQWIRLHQMIGDRHAGVDVNIRRPKPGGTVPLNIHVDTLLGDIDSALLTAAEVVAEKMNMDDPTRPKRPQEPPLVPPWASSPTLDVGERVKKCGRIVAPNLHLLMKVTGVAGREDDDPNIDVMVWELNGRWPMLSTTTGIELIKRLDHLGSLAYFTLGLTRARQQRDQPCTRCHSKSVGRWAGSDYWDCSACGSQFPEDELRRQDKILIELVKRGLITPEAS